MFQFNKMYRYVQFCFILIGSRLCSATIIEAYKESDAQNLYCEVFQNVNFDGESVQIPQSQKIINFTQLTQSWISSGSNEAETVYSFKLPASIPAGTVCVVKSCSSENFDGHCTVYKLSQKRIQSCRLKSFACNCFNESNDKCAENDGTVTEISNDGQSTVNQGCDEENSSFQNFTKLGQKIIGVGRNYIWHKTDLSKVVASGSSPQDPIIFMNPTSSYLSEGNLIYLPQNLGVIYYELELAVIIGKSANNVTESSASAMDYVAGYALALDMTAKEILKSSISKGLPWTLAKGFDGACPIGNFIPKACIPDPHDLQLSASINGITKQGDSTSQMIFKIPQLISYVSQFMTLEPNDVILTGTPDGFGQVKSGDVIEGWLNDNLAKIHFVVA